MRTRFELQTRIPSTSPGRSLLLAICTGAMGLVPAGSWASTFFVNSSADMPDANPGDNVCETAEANAACTLRAAVSESNAHQGPDSIILQANETYVLAGGVGSLGISDSVAITAAGPNAIIDGNGPVTLNHVFHVVKCIDDSFGMAEICNIGNVTASISGITIRNGRSFGLGGGIYNEAALTIANCTITNNHVTNDSGGGIFNRGSLTIDNSIISMNSAGAANLGGGGIFNRGQLTVTNSTIRGNTTPGSGGGVRNVIGSTIIRGSTLSGNTAGTGGALHVGGSGSAIINSTISGNFANGDGGGIFVQFGSLALFNSTVALNLANADSSGTAIGGGVYKTSGDSLTLTNSIVSLNESELPGVPFPTILADDCAGAITSQGNTIISDVDPNHCVVSGAYAAIYANLGPLQDNGGPTFTHALGKPSAAIDTGSIAGCTDNTGAQLTIDQRGSPRPGGLRCDIGAFEVSDRVFRDGFES